MYLVRGNTDRRTARERRVKSGGVIYSPIDLIVICIEKAGRLGGS
jgi:hypothetical protein